MIMFSFMARQL